MANRKFPVPQNHTQRTKLSTRSVLGGHELELTAPLLLNLFCKEVDLFKAAPCLPTVDRAVVVDQPLFSLLLLGELVGVLVGYTRERKEGREEKGGDERQWKIAVLPCLCI